MATRVQRTSSRLSLTVQVRYLQGVALIRLRGEAMAETAQHLGRELEAAVLTGPRAVVVDMAELRFIGAAGLSAIVRAHRMAALGHIRLALMRVPPLIRGVLERTRLAEVIPVCRTMEQAVAGATAPDANTQRAPQAESTALLALRLPPPVPKRNAAPKDAAAPAGRLIA